MPGGAAEQRERRIRRSGEHDAAGHPPLLMRMRGLAGPCTRRPERPMRPERPERPMRPERPERLSRPERPERGSRVRALVAAAGWATA